MKKFIKLCKDKYNKVTRKQMIIFIYILNILNLSQAILLGIMGIPSFTFTLLMSCFIIYLVFVANKKLV